MRNAVLFSFAVFPKRVGKLWRMDYSNTRSLWVPMV